MSLEIAEKFTKLFYGLVTYLALATATLFEEVEVVLLKCARVEVGTKTKQTKGC